MAQKKKRKLSNGIIVSIVIASVFFVAALSLFIANFFFPVKYIFAYLAIENDKNEAGQTRVTFLDVGYGDCTLIELSDGKTILIDGGDGTYSNNYKIFKTLKKRGIDKIDYLICSSVNEYRCGGLTDIVKYKEVGAVYAPYCPNVYYNDGYRDFAATLASEGLDAEICEYGVPVRCVEENYSVVFLSPSAHTVAGGEYDEFLSKPSADTADNASAIIWFEVDGVSFLFLGDARFKVQNALAESYKDFGFESDGLKLDFSECDILKVGGHGSDECTCVPLYDLLLPETAIISTGKNGRGYPSLKSLGDAQNYVGDKLYRTDYDGDIQITVKDGTYTVKKEK